MSLHAPPDSYIERQEHDLPGAEEAADEYAREEREDFLDAAWEYVEDLIGEAQWLAEHMLMDRILSGSTENRRRAQRTRSSDVEECSGEKPNCKSAGGSSEPADESQTLAGVMSLTAETTRSGGYVPPTQKPLPEFTGLSYVLADFNRRFGIKP